MSRFVTGKRKEKRTNMVVPVRVRLLSTTGPGESFVAHTLDASERGVKLAGFRTEIKVDDVIEIQHRHDWALFRVVWVHTLENSLEKQAGAECVELEKNIWGEEFARVPDEFEEKEL